jgi:hypothetical protein
MSQEPHERPRAKQEVVSMKAYDCQACGACCVDFFDTKACVVLEADEPQRMHRLGLPVVDAIEGPSLGTKEDGVGRNICAALSGVVGSKCSCSVYSERPRKCAAFLVGGLLCLIARREAGLDQESTNGDLPGRP